MANFSQIINFWFFFILLGCGRVESVVENDILSNIISGNWGELGRKGMWPPEGIPPSSSDFNPIAANEPMSSTSHPSDLGVQVSQNTPVHPIQGRISATSSSKSTLHPIFEILRAQGDFPRPANPIIRTENLPDSDWLWEPQSIKPLKVRELILIHTKEEKRREQLEAQAQQILDGWIPIEEMDGKKLRTIIFPYTLNLARIWPVRPITHSDELGNYRKSYEALLKVWEPHFSKIKSWLQGSALEAFPPFSELENFLVPLQLILRVSSKDEARKGHNLLIKYFSRWRSFLTWFFFEERHLPSHFFGQIFGFVDQLILCEDMDHLPNLIRITEFLISVWISSPTQLTEAERLASNAFLLELLSKFWLDQFSKLSELSNSEYTSTFLEQKYLRPERITAEGKIYRFLYSVQMLPFDNEHYKKDYVIPSARFPALYGMLSTLLPQPSEDTAEVTIPKAMGRASTHSISGSAQLKNKQLLSSPKVINSAPSNDGATDTSRPIKARMMRAKSPNKVFGLIHSNQPQGSHADLNPSPSLVKEALRKALNDQNHVIWKDHPDLFSMLPNSLKNQGIQTSTPLSHFQSFNSLISNRVPNYQLIKSWGPEGELRLNQHIRSSTTEQNHHISQLSVEGNKITQTLIPLPHFQSHDGQFLNMPRNEDGPFLNMRRDVPPERVWGPEGELRLNQHIRSSTTEQNHHISQLSVEGNKITQPFTPLPHFQSHDGQFLNMPRNEDGPFLNMRRDVPPGRVWGSQGELRSNEGFRSSTTEGNPNSQMSVNWNEIMQPFTPLPHFQRLDGQFLNRFVYEPSTIWKPQEDLRAHKRIRISATEEGPNPHVSVGWRVPEALNFVHPTSNKDTSEGLDSQDLEKRDDENLSAVVYGRKRTN